jgi:hypothetical protein
MGTTQSVVSRLERVKAVVSLRTVRDAARALGLELDIHFIPPADG